MASISSRDINRHSCAFITGMEPVNPPTKTVSIINCRFFMSFNLSIITSHYHQHFLRTVIVIVCDLLPAWIVTVVLPSAMPFIVSIVLSTLYGCYIFIGNGTTVVQAFSIYKITSQINGCTFSPLPDIHLVQSCLNRDYQ